MTKSPMGYDLLEPSGNDNVDIPTLWNAGVSNTETLFNELNNNFDALSMKPGNKTADVKTHDPDTNKPIWTSTITDADGVKLAEKIDKASADLSGKTIWTTTISIGGKTIIAIDKKTENGWEREVKNG